MSPRASTMAIEEANWKKITGLYIENVENHYQVRHTERINPLHTSAQRHECRAYIKGYIQGNLDSLKAEVDRRIAEAKENA